MSFNPSDEDLSLLYQQTKQIYSKVEILTKEFGVVKTIEGKLIDDDFNVDATSNMRRTYNCTLQVTEPLLKFERNEDFWFDRYIRPYIGIYNIRLRQIMWYRKGTFCSAAASHTYNETTNQLAVQCNDMMCRLDGTLDGKQPALSFTIPAGENIRQSIIGILAAFDFTNYNIPELPRNVQYDLEFGAGATAYDMISELMQFAPNYEFFFDVDGTFIVQRIPCYTNDPYVMNRTNFQNLLVSEDSYDVSFTAKNCVEVWGKHYDENNVDRFAAVDFVTYEDNVYTLEFDNLQTPSYNVGFTTTLPSSMEPDVKRALFVAQVKDQRGTFTCTYIAENMVWEISGGSTYIIDEFVPAKYAKSIWGLIYVGTPMNGAEFVVTVTDTMKLRNYMVFGMVAPSNNLYDFQISFLNHQTQGDTTVTQTFGPFVVRDDYEREIYPDTLIANTTYLFMYSRDEDAAISDPNYEKIYYMGHLTPTAQYKNTDEASSFSIENMGGEYWEICVDGEYANITSDLLAKERAMYECYYKANLNERLQLTILDVPWLDVNKKISYQRTCFDKPQDWMIQSISSKTLNGTCTVSMVRFYPDWSEVFNQNSQ